MSILTSGFPTEKCVFHTHAPSPSQVCDDFTEEVDGQEKELRLMRADLSIDCDGEEYKNFLGWPVLMIVVFPIGVPLLYASESHRACI